MTDAAWTVESPAGPIRLRPEHDGDRAFRFRLFCQSRPEEWSVVPLAPALLDLLLQQQFQAQTISYRTQFPAARFAIIEHQSEPIGRIVVDRPGDQIHVVDQAVTPALRNRGIGTAVMRALMAEATRARLPLRLKVASSNDPSMRLYLRLRFTVVEETAMYLDMAWRPEGIA